MIKTLEISVSGFGIQDAENPFIVTLACGSFGGYDIDPRIFFIGILTYGIFGSLAYGTVLECKEKARRLSGLKSFSV